MPRIAGIPNGSEARDFWLAKLANLNAEADHGREIAPHKPLLLFCMLDLLDAGAIVDGRVDMSAELVFRFETYWSFVLDRRKAKGDIRLPFHALGSKFDRVWERFMEDGAISPGREATRSCVIEPSLWQCLQASLTVVPKFLAGDGSC